MEILLIVLVLAGVAAAGVVAAGRRRKPDPPPVQLSPADEQRALDGDVRKLAPGDVVNFDSTDFLVERTMVFDEDGFTWSEHLLADSVTDRRLWLSVEDDDRLEVALYEKVDGAALEPGPAEVTHSGVTYRRDEQGKANWRAATVSGPGDSGAMEYADYVAGEQLLAFERYGTGGWEVSTGKVISEHAVEVYPAR